jgi:cytochrome oxidase assembly protein ShyY1
MLVVNEITCSKTLKFTLWLVTTMLVFSGLIKLGLWQLERGQEKQQSLALMAEKQVAGELGLSDIINLNQGQFERESLNDVPVNLIGQFDNQHIFLLDNQVDNGRVGYRVIQIFNHDNGYQVLVNLGWVVAPVSRQDLPQLSSFEGSYKLAGKIRFIEQGIVLNSEVGFEPLGENYWPLRIQAIEIEKISEITGVKLLPFIVYLDKKDTVGYKKNWHPIVMPPEKHFGYAFQWLSLAAAWLILMIIAWNKAKKNNNK